MDLQPRKEGDVLVLKVTGRLDAVTAPEYESKVRKMIDEGDIRLVLDFDELNYISSAGLRGLLVTAKLVKARQGNVCFANIKGAVKEVFGISGFQSIFSMHDSVAAAVDTFS